MLHGDVDSKVVGRGANLGWVECRHQFRSTSSILCLCCADHFDFDYNGDHDIGRTDDHCIDCQRENDTAQGGGNGTAWERLQKVKTFRDGNIDMW